MEIPAPHTESSWIYCRGNCSEGLPTSPGAPKEKDNFGALRASPAIRISIPTNSASRSFLHILNAYCYHLFDYSHSLYSGIFYCVFEQIWSVLRYNFIDLSNGTKGERNTWQELHLQDLHVRL